MILVEIDVVIEELKSSKYKIDIIGQVSANILQLGAAREVERSHTAARSLRAGDAVWLAVLVLVTVRIFKPLWILCNQLQQTDKLNLQSLKINNKKCACFL